MKKSIAILVVSFVLFSCSSVHVYQDFDTRSNFNNYKTYAFYKNGIDKVEISDLDKRRILFAIEENMTAKGFTKSSTPDILVSFFTKEKERVNVYNNNNWGIGFGWVWGWGWGMNQPMVSTNTEGTLFIDFIDANKKELIWQGEGIGNLPKGAAKKEEVINKFVSKILMQFPPENK